MSWPRWPGLQIDNAVVEIDAGECPGCDGSSQVVRRGPRTMPGSSNKIGCARPWCVEESISIREGDAVLAIHPHLRRGGLTLSYHLDYGRDAAIPAQSFCVGLSRRLLSRGAGIQPDLPAGDGGQGPSRRRDRRPDHRGRSCCSSVAEGVVGNRLRYADECARHKILDMVGDLALMGVDLHGFVVAHRSGHQTNATLARRLVEQRESPEPDPPGSAAPAQAKTARSTWRGS